MLLGCRGGSRAALSRWWIFARPGKNLLALISLTDAEQSQRDKDKIPILIAQ